MRYGARFSLGNFPTFSGTDIFTHGQVLLKFTYIFDLLVYTVSFLFAIPLYFNSSLQHITTDKRL